MYIFAYPCLPFASSFIVILMRIVLALSEYFSIIQKECYFIDPLSVVPLSGHGQTQIYVGRAQTLSSVIIRVQTMFLSSPCNDLKSDLF